MKNSKRNSRRDFIKNVGLSTAAVTFAGALPAFSASSYRRIIGANDRFIAGVMGVNSRGLALATTFAKQSNALVGYVSDVDSRASEKCIERIGKLQSSVPQNIPDFRKALQQKDMDILIVATPDHWHAPAALLGMQAGKHIYLEKPCSHNPREGEMLIASQKKHGKILQMGNQRRSFPNLRLGIKELHDGVIGKVYYAKTWYANSRKPFPDLKAVAIPSWLNFDLWQGPAPRRQYMENLIHYNWHWYWHWGTGEALNNGTHMVDLARWGMQVDFPTKVTSTGGKYVFDNWETPDTQVIGWEFGNKGAISWEGRSANGAKSEGDSVGVIFFGEKGTMQIGGGNGYKVLGLDGTLIKEVKPTSNVDATDAANPAGLLDGFHIQNMFNAIKGSGKLNSDIESGHISTLLVQLGNIAQRTSGLLYTNPSNGRILNNPKAMQLWSRTYQKGWEPKI